MQRTTHRHLLGLTLLALGLWACQPSQTEDIPINRDLPDYTAVSQVENGRATNVKFTTYSTTLKADGTDKARLRITVIDSLGREITSASNPIHLYVEGGGQLTTLEGEALPTATDTAGHTYGEAQLTNGELELYFVAGATPDKTVVRAASPDLWSGEHEIHCIRTDQEFLTPSEDQLPPTTIPIDDMIGADISFLPQMEARGVTFTDNGEPVDAIELLRDKGFNYIRLRLFVNPEHEDGYSPEQGFCGLDYTVEMAKRIKAAGMKFLLDFHYSDYWADPQKQYKPKAWEGLDYETLKDTVQVYTARVIQTLADAGAKPDMVQVGNEINHGIIWPDGHIGNLDGLAGLLKAGVAGVEQVDEDIQIMMHIALGGQNKESVFWLDNMFARGVTCDLIGLSFYPRWHGTLNDLQANLYDLMDRYHKPLNVVEYSNFKKEVNEIVFNMPDGMGTGTAIWEPLNSRSGLFDEELETTDLFKVYEEAAKSHLDQ